MAVPVLQHEYMMETPCREIPLAVDDGVLESQVAAFVMLAMQSLICLPCFRDHASMNYPARYADLTATAYARPFPLRSSMFEKRCTIL
jgi:hypothetical protein